MNIVGLSIRQWLPCPLAIWAFGLLNLDIKVIVRTRDRRGFRVEMQVKKNASLVFCRRKQKFQIILKYIQKCMRACNFFSQYCRKICHKTHTRLFLLLLEMDRPGEWCFGRRTSTTSSAAPAQCNRRHGSPSLLCLVIVQRVLCSPYPVKQLHVTQCINTSSVTLHMFLCSIYTVQRNSCKPIF